MSNNILLRFSDEEMMYLLRALHVGDFPGLEADALNKTVDEQTSLVLDAADHSLQARGFVQWQSATERIILPLVRKVLLDCAQPRYTLFLEKLSVGSATTKALFIFGAEVIVEQSEPEPHVQQYLIIATHEDLTQRLQTLIAEENAHPTTILPGGRLPLDLWKEVVKAAPENEAAAGNLLARSLPRQTASALAAAVHQARSIRYLTSWKQTPTAESHTPEKRLLIVTGSSQRFLLWQEAPEHTHFIVLPNGAEKLQACVERIIPVS